MTRVLEFWFSKYLNHEMLHLNNQGAQVFLSINNTGPQKKIMYILRTNSTDPYVFWPSKSESKIRIDRSVRVFLWINIFWVKNWHFLRVPHVRNKYMKSNIRGKYSKTHVLAKLYLHYYVYEEKTWKSRIFSFEQPKSTYHDFGKYKSTLMAWPRTKNFFDFFNDFSL